MATPTVICHMMTSIDGRILIENLGNSERLQQVRKLYEEKHRSYHGQAWICGRQTMQKDFAEGVGPEIPGSGPADRMDYIADHRAESFCGGNRQGR